MLQNRITNPLYLIDKDLLLQLLMHNLNWGNHPIYNIILEQKINKFISEELSKGFLLLIIIDRVTDIPFAKAYPIYIVK